MGSMTENIADKAINDTRIVKQFTNPVKEPIDSDINLFDLLDNRAKRDPEGAMIEYKGDDGTWHPYSAQVFRDMVIDLAKGLVGLGVNKGDSVAIVAYRNFCGALDWFSLSVGGVGVSRGGVEFVPVDAGPVCGRDAVVRFGRRCLFALPQGVGDE